MKEFRRSMRPEDFLISVRPQLDPRRLWTGQVDVTIMSSHENPLNDEDFYSLMSFCRTICSSIPVMEEDDYVRDKLEAKADEYENRNSNEKAKVVDNDDNVVYLSFNTDTEGNA